MAATATDINSPPMAGVHYIQSRPPQMVSGAPIIFQAPAQRHSGLLQHQLTSMKALSIVQIICGALSIVFDTSLIVTTYHGTIGSGIWCGLFFLVAGILGVVGAVQNRKCLFIATMVMSILSSVFLFVIIGFNGALLSYCSDRWYGSYYYCYTNEYAFGSLLLILAVTELIVSIWASVLCCKGVCSMYIPQSMPYTTQHVYYAAQPPMSTQVTVVPPTNYMVAQQSTLIAAGQPNLNQPIYPQQQYAAGSMNYAAGVAGPPPYAK